nr:MAG TPA: 3-ketoacyl-ACP reductase [Caudoviricetes sp.]
MAMNLHLHHLVTTRQRAPKILLYFQRNAMSMVILRTFYWKIL